MNNLLNRIKRLESALTDDNPWPAWKRYRQTGILPDYEPELEKVEFMMAWFMFMDAVGGSVLTVDALGFTPTKRAAEAAKAGVLDADSTLVDLPPEQYVERVFKEIDKLYD